MSQKLPGGPHTRGGFSEVRPLSTDAGMEVRPPSGRQSRGHLLSTALGVLTILRVGGLSRSAGFLLPLPGHSPSSDTRRPPWGVGGWPAGQPALCMLLESGAVDACAASVAWAGRCSTSLLGPAVHRGWPEPGCAGVWRSLWVPLRALAFPPLLTWVLLPFQPVTSGLRNPPAVT